MTKPKPRPTCKATSKEALSATEKYARNLRRLIHLEIGPAIANMVRMGRHGDGGDATPVTAAERPDDGQQKC